MPQESAKIVVLSTYGMGVPVPDKLIQAIFATLRRERVSVADIYVEQLDLNRTNTPSYRSHVLQMLTDQLTGKRVAAVITLSSLALSFYAEHEQELFPGALTITLMQPDTAPLRRLSAPAINLPNRGDFDDTLELALALFPRTRKVLLFCGQRISEDLAYAMAQDTFRSWQTRLDFELTNELRHEEALDKAKHLPADTICLYTPFFNDKTGRSFIPLEVLDQLAQVANVPIFSMYDAFLGHGIVGGSYVVLDTIGERAAKLASSFRAGTYRAAPGFTTLETPSQRFLDWNLLQRWKIDPYAVPSDATIVNRPPTLWSQYRDVVLAAGVAFAGLIALSTGLWVLNRRLRITEADARSGQERYRVLVERAPEAIAVFDLDRQCVVDANTKALKLFGLDRATLETTRPLPLFPSDTAEGGRSIDDTLKARIASSDEVVFDRPIRAADGQMRVCEIRLSVMPDRMRHLLRASLIDITERKQAELVLQRYREQLEADVRDRTQALQSARDAADKANRAKSTFLATMSHELRTPLNAILGFSQLLGRDPGFNADSQRKLSSINRAGQHLLALINDILEISRIESGRVNIQTTPFSLSELLLRVEDIVRGRAESKGLTLHMGASPAVPAHLLGDQQRLQQILINLLGNAVKFTEHGRVELRVSPYGSTVRFEVIDTGPGMTVDEQQRLFRPFYQTDSGRATPGGAGLGLAISHQYAALMGGQLSVASQPGVGSTFTLDLPLPEAVAPPKAATQTPAASLPFAHRWAIGQPPPRVLVVDDNADNRELAQQLAAAAGFDVQSVADGQAAIEAFATWNPQFIWMDLQLPVVDGYEATRRIRALPGGRDVRIVALTASTFEEERQRVLACGCDDMLHKPLDAERFYGVMAQLLGIGHADDGLASGASALDWRELNPAQRQRLRSAAAELDLGALREAIANLRPQRPAHAQVLEAWLQDFDFERISAACANAD